MKALRKNVTTIIVCFVGILILASWLLMSGIICENDDDNLLNGTNFGVHFYYLSDKGYDAKLATNGRGVKVTSRNYNNSKDGGDGYLILFFDDGHSREILSGPSGDLYSLSFDVKSNISDAVIEAAHSGLGKADCQIDFGIATSGEVNKWTTVKMIGALNGVEPSSQGVFLDLRNNPAGTEICIKNLTLRREEDEKKN